MPVIHNGTIINEQQCFSGHIEYSRQGIITKVGKGPYTGPDTEIYDAQGGYIIPGAIDDQVHFRTPGLTHKGTIQSESRAAAAGGVTSFMDMPNTSPQTTTMAAWEEKMEIAAMSSAVNYAFFFGATTDNLDVLRKLDARVLPGVKLFMGSSTGGMLVDGRAALEPIFAECPVLIATHCEDESMIRAMMAHYGQGATIADHPQIRSAEACYRSSALAVEIATKYGARLHVLHLSTGRELSLFESKPLAQKRVTAEVCAHHLWFSEGDYPQGGNFLKCNPAIKTSEDRTALREGLQSGKIDIVATDHAPHTLEEKMQAYVQAPSGMPMVQHSVASMFEIFAPIEVVDYMCHRPAECLGVEGRGYLRVGYFADIAIVAKRGQVVEREGLLYKCGWSPLEGVELGHSIAATFVNGVMVWDGAEVLENRCAQPLKFNN